MAETEVRLRYRSLPAQFALLLLCPFVPLFFIFALWAFSVTVWAGAMDQLAGPIAAIIAALLPTTFLASLLALLACLDDTILLTRDGLSCSVALSPGFGLRTEKPWSSLSLVRLVPGVPVGQRLELHFTRSAPVVIDADRLSPGDVEQLLLAVQVWAPHLDLSAQLPAIRRQLLSDTDAGENGAPSFTHLWEEELARRFSSTNFIPLEPGEKVRNGDLTVVRQLAFGGLSAIYLVKNAQQDVMVLKEAIVPAEADSSATKKALELFERESSLLGRLNHPGLARVLDRFVEGGRNYMVLEHIKGIDLRQLVRQEGPQAEDRVIKWGMEIAEILAYLHSQTPPVVHRDLSPDNLMLREDGTLAVIDFGAANELIGTATGTMIGKQAYIAPEQLRGKATPQSDIYSLGGTLHCLVTGEDPEPLSASHPRRLRSEVSAEFDNFIGDCTQLEASDRCPSAGAAFDRLLSMSEGKIGIASDGVLQMEQDR